MNEDIKLPNEITEEYRDVLAFEPQKTFLMKCVIKGAGYKPKTLHFLVQADDYTTAKELAKDFTNKHTHKKLSVSSVIGSEIKHEYLLREPKEK